MRALIGAVWRLFGRHEVQPRPDPNVEYRRHEKEKAIAAMSVTQRLKAAELNEGDVADLEWNGATAIVIMEATSNVYEWDGFNWVDRYPNRI